MAKPFEYGSDGSQLSAKERFAKRVEESKRKSDDNDDDGFDDDDDDEPSSRDDDDDDDDDGPGEGSRASDDDLVIDLTRKEKKQKRNERYHNDLQESRRELAETKERLARLEGAITAQRTSERDRTDERQEDPYQTEIDSLDEQLRGEYSALQNNAKRTQADIDKYNKRQREIEDKKASIRVDREFARRGIRQGSNPEAEARAAAIRNEFADVYANKSAIQYADAAFKMMQAEGAPDNKQTLDAAMAKARKKFNLGGEESRRQPPRESTKRKFEQPRNGSGGASRSSGDSDEGLTLRMTKDLRAMANARYSHIPDEKKRFEAFAKSKAGRNLARSIRDGKS